MIPSKLEYIIRNSARVKVIRNSAKVKLRNSIEENLAYLSVTVEKLKVRDRNGIDSDNSGRKEGLKSE